MTEKLERVLKFVVGRRKPVTAKLVAQQFLIAQATASTHLRHLHAAGHLTRQEIKGKVVWCKKGEDPFVPVAVSEEPAIVEPSRPAPVKWEQPKPTWPENPFKTSYPHVRGYDD